MSRIGKKPVSVPKAVKVSHDQASRTVRVEGPKGKLAFEYHPVVAVQWNEGEREFACSIPESRQEEGQARAHWGTTRSRLQGLVEGVTTGFSKKLEVNGVGWNARLQGRNLVLSVGYCNAITLAIPMGLECAVEGNVITVSGPDKQQVGAFASRIRSTRKPEPYNGKGIKYTDETIIRKQGKAFGS